MEWINIKDRLPDVDRKVLLLVGKRDGKPLWEGEDFTHDIYIGFLRRSNSINGIISGAHGLNFFTFPSKQFGISVEVSYWLDLTLPDAVILPGFCED